MKKKFIHILLAMLLVPLVSISKQNKTANAQVGGCIYCDADGSNARTTAGDSYYLYFIITDENDTSGKISLYKLNTTPTTVTNVVIPSVVTCNEKPYYVTEIKGNPSYSDYYGFRDYTNLVSITLPESLESIGQSSFNGCTSLKSITLPKNVSKIESGAFYGCTTLEEVYIEAITPAELGTNAFGDCNNLSKIYVPETSVDAYKSAWADFSDLINKMPTKISDILPNTFPTQQVYGWVNERGSRCYLNTTENNLVIGQKKVPVSSFLVEGTNQYTYSFVDMFIYNATVTINVDSNGISSINYSDNAPVHDSNFGTYKPYGIQNTINPITEGSNNDIEFITNGFGSASSVILDTVALIENEDYVVTLEPLKVKLLGDFVKDLGKGTHTLTISSLGYNSLNISFSVVHGHKVEQTFESVAPSCEQAGHLAYYKCNCGKYFKDLECTNEIGDSNALTTWLSLGSDGYIAALGHDYSQTPTYTWNNNTCHAVIKCNHDGCNSSIEETKQATYVKDSDATNKSNEKGHYEVTFNDTRLGSNKTENNSIEIEGSKLSNKLSKAAIILIVVGSTVGVCLIAYVVMFVIWKKKQIGLKFLFKSFDFVNKLFK